MKQIAAPSAGRDMPRDEHMRFVDMARKQAKCRACGMPIPAGVNHLCFRYQDAGWLRSFRLCSACLNKIMRAIKRKPKPAKQARMKADVIVSNIALPDKAFFKGLGEAIESSRPEAAQPASREGSADVCEQCGRPVDGECPECGRRRREWF